MGRGLTERIVQVKSRIARLSYGWIYNIRFDDKIHDPRDKVWDELKGFYQAVNQVKWIIKRVRSYIVSSCNSRVTDC
jgi:hypothetical protein